MRIAAFVTLVMVQQLLPPLAMAQVDPCEPVPIPELCDPVDPSPSPSPSPDKDGNGGGKGGGNGGGKGGGGQQQGGGKGDDREVGDGGKPPLDQAKKKGKKNGDAADEPVLGARFSLGGSRDTSRLVAIVSELKPYGMSVRQALLEVVGPFPVAGLTYWSDDWHACRDGCDRLHKGLDMFAKEGTPLVAIADGVVTQKVVGDLAGISIEITDDHGVEYFYAHMSSWAPGIRAGQRVKRGDVIGYVGRTGNARFTPDHLHLEIQPGGVPVAPKPFVDRWLKVAEQRALELVARTTGEPLPVASSDFRLMRSFDLAGEGATGTLESQEFLALAGLQPSVSSLQLARRMLAEMAWEIDWSGRADADLAALAERYGRLLSETDLADASPWLPLGSSTGHVPEAGD